MNVLWMGNALVRLCIVSIWLVAWPGLTHGSGAVVKCLVEPITKASDVLSKPSDLVVSEDIVYVVDSGNHRIVAFDQTGRMITTYGGAGRRLGEFVAPEAIDLGPHGLVYVSDIGNERIVAFCPLSRDFSVIDEGFYSRDLAATARHLAYAGDRFELQKNPNAGLVLVRNEKGEVKQVGSSFHLDSERPRLELIANGIKLDCSETHVAVGSIPLAVVRLYTLEGELLKEFFLDCENVASIRKQSYGTMFKAPDEAVMKHRRRIADIDRQVILEDLVSLERPGAFSYAWYIDDLALRDDHIFAMTGSRLLKIDFDGRICRRYEFFTDDGSQAFIRSFVIDEAGRLWGVDPDYTHTVYRTESADWRDRSGGRS